MMVLGGYLLYFTVDAYSIIKGAMIAFRLPPNVGHLSPLILQIRLSVILPESAPLFEESLLAEALREYILGIRGALLDEDIERLPKTAGTDNSHPMPYDHFNRFWLSQYILSACPSKPRWR
jgi:hypothetical protein